MYGGFPQVKDASAVTASLRTANQDGREVTNYSDKSSLLSAKHPQGDQDDQAAMTARTAPAACGSGGWATSASQKGTNLEKSGDGGQSCSRLLLYGLTHPLQPQIWRQNVHVNPESAAAALKLVGTTLAPSY